MKYSKAFTLVAGMVTLSIAGCGAWLRTSGGTAGPQGELTTDQKLALFAKKHGYELRRFDLNRDEEPDIFKFFVVEFGANGEMVSEELIRQDIDINHDGFIDLSRRFGDGGALKEEHADLDFDGRVDAVNFFTNGKLVRKEIDLDYDSVVDLVKRYEGGKLVVVESDENKDGKIDSWAYYEGGELDRIGRDIDGDGTVDTWERSKPALAEDPGEEAQEKEKESPTAEE